MLIVMEFYNECSAGILLGLSYAKCLFKYEYIGIHVYDRSKSTSPSRLTSASLVLVAVKEMRMYTAASAVSKYPDPVLPQLFFLFRVYNSQKVKYLLSQ